jgi:hypothetical protein
MRTELHRGAAGIKNASPGIGALKNFRLPRGHRTRDAVPADINERELPRAVRQGGGRVNQNRKNAASSAKSKICVEAVRVRSLLLE